MVSYAQNYAALRAAPSDVSNVGIAEAEFPHVGFANGATRPPALDAGPAGG